MSVPQAAARYRQVKHHVLERIAAGTLRAGERVPSENELVRALAISRMTANRALKELTAEGVLVRPLGAGLAISPPLTIQPEHLELIAGAVGSALESAQVATAT